MSNKHFKTTLSRDICSDSEFGSGLIPISTPEKVLIALCHQSIYQCVVLVSKSARTNK